MMKCRNVLHAMLLATETSVLAFLVLLPMFSRLEVAKRVYIDHPISLRFRLAGKDAGRLGEISNFNIYYTTERDRLYSERQVFSVPVSSGNNEGWFTVSFPAGLYSFRLDFRLKESSTFGREAPEVDVRLGEKSFDRTKLRMFYEEIYGFSGYLYWPKPFANGYGFELFACVCGIWLLTFVGIGFALRRESR